jgi:hypothetical protein
MLGEIISGIGSIAGGLFGKSSAEKANKQNIQLQKDFAQQGIQWKVADAKAAGVHPLAGLGAQTISYTPSVVGDNSLATGISQAGQDIGRAVNSTRTQDQRISAVAKTAADLALEGAALDNRGKQIQNALLASKLATSSQVGAAMQAASGANNTGMPGQNSSKLTRVDIGSLRSQPAPVSDAQTFEDRYGEVGGAAAGLGIAAADLWKTAGHYGGPYYNAYIRPRADYGALADAYRNSKYDRYRRPTGGGGGW